MPGLGFTFPQGPELIVILGIVVLLFGAKKLPELGSSIGKTITNFKKGVAEGQEEDREDGADAAGEHVETGEHVDAGEPSEPHRDASA